MPVLQQGQAERPGVYFVFINQGESRIKVDAWWWRRNLQLNNVLMDETRTAGAAFKQSALPTTLFFDAEGRHSSTRIGELSQATLAERLTATGPQCFPPNVIVSKPTNGPDNQPRTK